MFYWPNPDPDVLAKIQVSIAVSQPNYGFLNVTVTFTNVCSETILFGFKDVSKEAARYHLRLFKEGIAVNSDVTGLRIPIQRYEEQNPFAPGGVHSFVIEGKLNGNDLNFIGCPYRLTPDTTYQFQFGFFGLRSNVAEWHFSGC